MELYLKYRNAVSLDWDKKVEVSSYKEWYEAIYNPDVISSILYPTEPIISFEKVFKRKHYHEINYKNNSEKNTSYLNACKKLAERLNTLIKDKKCIVYAPLRGALPIWNVIKQFLIDSKITVYYPVTSSFVMYPFEFNIINKKNKSASGRFTNILELKRIKPFLKDFDLFIYVDEIVSGSMMNAHLKEMAFLNINKLVPVVAVGLADRFGERSIIKRSVIEHYKNDGKLLDFLWEGCQDLITEDQKFLLGIHYYSNLLGPNIIPVFNTDLKYFEEKIIFEKEIMNSENSLT